MQCKLDCDTYGESEMMKYFSIVVVFLMMLGSQAASYTIFNCRYNCPPGSDMEACDKRFIHVNGELFTVIEDGMKAIGQTPDGSFIGSPSWKEQSSDGDRLLFVMNINDGQEFGMGTAIIIKSMGYSTLGFIGLNIGETTSAVDSQVEGQCFHIEK